MPSQRDSIRFKKSSNIIGITMAIITGLATITRSTDSSTANVKSAIVSTWLALQCNSRRLLLRKLRRLIKLLRILQRRVLSRLRTRRPLASMRFSRNTMQRKLRCTQIRGSQRSTCAARKVTHRLPPRTLGGLMQRSAGIVKGPMRLYVKPNVQIRVDLRSAASAVSVASVVSVASASTASVVIAGEAVYSASAVGAGVAAGVTLHGDERSIHVGTVIMPSVGVEGLMAAMSSRFMHQAATSVIAQRQQATKRAYSSSPMSSRRTSRTNKIRAKRYRRLTMESFRALTKMVTVHKRPQRKIHLKLQTLVE